RARRDEDGYLWFGGRAEHVISPAGCRIGPFEVESALLEHPAVVESAVVASPDPVRGEIVKAFVVLRPGHAPGEALVRELQEHVKRVTAPYKYPRAIEFVASLPKTVSGKIRRVELRESEAGRALGRLGLGAGDVTFLGYADGGLAAAWSGRWQVARRDVGDVSATRLVDALHAALRTFEPDTVVLPMPLDRHPDHAALGRLTMLAMLEEPGQPDLLAYLVHGGPGWPAHRRSAGCGTIPRPGGCSASLAWADLRLDPPTIALKASLIEEYRSQLARGAVLRPFAAENEPFTGGVLVHANRAMSRWRPGVHRASGGVAIDVPRSACGADVAGGGRLRLRYVEAEEIQERLVMLGAVPQVLGGAPGGALVAADDVRVALAPRAVRLRLNGRAVADVRGV